MSRPARKIAFVSPHCVLDFTNGAATATLDGLALLARLGFECHAFCNTHIDAWEEVLVEEILAKRRVPYQVRNARIGAYQGRMIFTSHGQVPVTLFNSASTRGGWASPEEIAAFLSGCEIFLRKNRPDLVWTYGGDPISVLLHEIVRRLGIPILFALHNFNYRDAGIFAPADYATVPTEFARRFYRETIGLECQVLPLVMDGGRVRVDRGSHPNPLPEGEGTSAPQYVTFVNPEPRKGVHVFARIAEVLSRRRPDIRLLLVEGAAKTNFLSIMGIDITGLRNVTTMPNTPDPREFYAVSRLILMPSLMENAGFVAMEAMTNGIPVLASNRGGLPETIGEACPMIEIPARYTPETRELPTAEEVEPWVTAIIRLWDDSAEYERWRLAALERAKQWTPERLAPVYREFFGNLLAGTGDGEPYSSRSA